MITNYLGFYPLEPLFYAGIQLEDGLILKNYHIMNGSTLILDLSEKYTIFVRTLTGKKIRIHTKISSTIWDVKFIIQCKEGYSVHEQS